MCCFDKKSLLSSLYRVRAYKTLRFIEPLLKDVTLEVDNIAYNVGTFSDAATAQAAILAQFFALGHYSPTEILDVRFVTVSFDVGNAVFNLAFNLIQGFQLRFGLKINGVSLTDTMVDFGVYTDFVQGTDGFAAADVSSFNLRMNSQTYLQSTNAPYDFLPQLKGSTFDNSLVAADNYEIAAKNLNGTEFFSATRTNINAVADAARDAMYLINAANGYGNNSLYVTLLTEADSTQDPELRLFCVDELKVNNGSLPQLVNYDSAKKTGFVGNLGFYGTKFLEVSNIYFPNPDFGIAPPMIELTYNLGQQSKAQVFLWDAATESYQPL